ncbi:MAG TPA: sigma-70 family RNA polymerase sigma factor, partial [Solirubrobacteraceae bacterium]
PGGWEVGPMTEATAVDPTADAGLLIRIAAGDAGDPMAALYDRYAGRIYSLGKRLLRDEGLADELVQETFVRVWRAAGRFDPARGSASAFIFALAKNLAIDLRRRPSSRALEELPESVGLADNIDELVLGLTMQQALADISESQREVLTALYAHGERAVDVAERLGIPAATVRTRAFHGLRALAASLERLGFEAH